MKKNLIYLLALLFISTFTACHDDDNNPTPTPTPEPTPIPVDAAYESEGEYNVISTIYDASNDLRDTLDVEGLHIYKTAENLIKIKTPFIEIGKLRLGTITVDSIPVTANDKTYSFEIKDCSSVNTSNFPNPVVNIKGSVSEKAIKLNMTLKNEEYTIDFTFDGGQVKNNEAKLISITIDSKEIATTPERDGNTITFYVTMNTDMTKLQFTPELVISKGAISNPASGETVDFSKAENNTVTYTVVSEDLQISNNFEIVIKQGTDVSKNSFEEWVAEDKYFKPQGAWATSNPGITLIKNLGSIMGVNYKGGAIVLPEENGQSGKAAKIITANTEGGASPIPGMFPSIPKITSGSLFLGAFDVDPLNTLNSTQFGIPYFEKPANVKGYFKFKPGKDYYYCPDVQNSNLAQLDDSKTDQCALSAVLYEVSNFDEYLNGENIFTSDKIVAIAQKVSGEVSDFTAFDLKLEYKKEYDPSKKYRFAVIFSSSKDGDKFSGAPDSELVVDEVEITNE